MDAIQGIDLTGFIGETYRLFPFPREEGAFKQSPEGYKTRELIESIVHAYARLSRVPVTIEKPGNTFAIGEYIFGRHWFHELLRYVWRGGYPRWKDEIRPQYVIDLKEAIEKSDRPLFRLKFEQ